MSCLICTNGPPSSLAAAACYVEATSLALGQGGDEFAPLDLLAGVAHEAKADAKLPR